MVHNYLKKLDTGFHRYDELVFMPILDSAPVFTGMTDY